MVLAEEAAAAVLTLLALLVAQTETTAAHPLEAAVLGKVGRMRTYQQAAAVALVAREDQPVAQAVLTRASTQSAPVAEEPVVAVEVPPQAQPGGDAGPEVPP